MEKLVAMVIICSLPNGHFLKESWRIEKTVTLEHCLIMNKTFSGAGDRASISVKCGEIEQK